MGLHLMQALIELPAAALFQVGELSLAASF
jgi:hypothetical protein